MDLAAGESHDRHDVSSGRPSPRGQGRPDGEVRLPLRSKIFAGDPKLEECLVSDPAHLTLGARGEAVGKVQKALILLGEFIGGDDLPKSFYGAPTRDAVLRYKTKRGIINHTYQSAPDGIVGKMTIAALDAEMRALENKPPPPEEPPKFEVEVRQAVTPCRVRTEVQNPPFVQIERGALDGNTFQITGKITVTDPFAYHCGFLQTMLQHNVVGNYSRDPKGPTQMRFLAEMPSMPIRDHGGKGFLRDSWQAGDVKLVGSNMFNRPSSGDAPAETAVNPLPLRHGDSPKFRFPTFPHDRDEVADDPTMLLRDFVFELEFATWLCLKDGISPIVVFVDSLTFVRHWRWKLTVRGRVNYIGGNPVVTVTENTAPLLHVGSGMGAVRPLISKPDANEVVQRLFRAV
jgi:hypothetical protein